MATWSKLNQYSLPFAAGRFSYERTNISCNGSRYGGLKQIDPVGKNGEIIMDFSLKIIISNNMIMPFKAISITLNGIIQWFFRHFFNLIVFHINTPSYNY